MRFTKTLHLPNFYFGFAYNIIEVDSLKTSSKYNRIKCVKIILSAIW